MVLYQQGILILIVGFTISCLLTTLVVAKENREMSFSEKELDLSGIWTSRNRTPVIEERFNLRDRFNRQRRSLNWFLSFPSSTYEESEEDQNARIFISNSLGILKDNECTVWNGHYYRTINGVIFESTCDLKLVQSYNLLISTIGDTNLTINYEGKNYTFQYQDKMNKFEIDNKESNIPYENKVISAKEKAGFVIINLKGIDVTIKFSGYRRVSIQMNSNLWNEMNGICSDNSLTDDYNLRNGLRSWFLNANYWDYSNCLSDLTMREENNKEGICKDTFNGVHLEDCKQLKSYFEYKAACFYYTGDIKGEYQTAQLYIEECIKEKMKYNSAVTHHLKQINNHLCPPGKNYSFCGPTVEPTCQTFQLRMSNFGCTEGCFCPDLVQNGKCVRREDCTCQWKTRTYKNGQKISKDCNTCICTFGVWNCTNMKCGARCSVVGGSHYLTFDGRMYDLGGTCSRYLVKSNNYSIEYGKLACSEHFFDSGGNFYGDVSCPKSLRIWLKNDVITLKRPNRVLVNALDVDTLPMHLSDATITLASSLYISVKLTNAIEVWWSENHIYIDLPFGHEEATGGLCGTYNHNIRDDFLTPQGDIEENAVVFGDKWKTDEMCNENMILSPLNPCDWDPHKKIMAQTACKPLMSYLFSACHVYVDVSPFYELCIQESCLCQSDPNSCSCPIYTAYSAQCSNNNITVNWWNFVPQCALKCPSGQIYQSCGNSCTRTCQHVAMNKCKVSCVEGCNCPPGLTLNSTGQCIPLAECPCFYDGERFSAGRTLVMHSDKGPQFCKCQEAKWICLQLTAVDIAQSWHENSEIKCNETLNQEFTKCKPSEPETCKTMRSITSRTNKACFPGCVCKKGFVWEPTSKRCVDATQCPCQHNQKSYGTGEKIAVECNTCTCTNGVWSCTDNACSSVCSMWGWSHVKTFDGKLYDFQGSCEYLMAYGSLANNDTFIVTVQVSAHLPNDADSFPVTIYVGSNNETTKVELKTPMNILPENHLTHVSVKDVGSSILAEVRNLGVMIQWDKSVSVTVRVDPRWKNKVKGLCGDFNGYEMDDFNAYGETTNDLILYIDSWRLQDSCPQTEILIPSCQSGSREKALERCSPLKSTIFQTCHSEISFRPYLERCVNDVCDGTNGTQYHPECAAIAAYATQCSHWGIPIKWRNSTFCPICVNSNFEYTACVSTNKCPAYTCDSYNKSNATAEICSKEMCFEGCDKPLCPPHHVLKNDHSSDCIPVTQCQNFCLTENNVMYWEGDVMEEDDCHKCHCFQHEKMCFDKPCNESIPEGPLPEPGKGNPELKNTNLTVENDTGKFCFYEYETGNNSEHTSGVDQNIIHKQVGDEWFDGPCKSCSCTVKGGNAQVVCSVIQCSSLRQHPDYHEYELLQVFNHDKCCPQVVRKRCKHLGQIFEVNDSWVQNTSKPCEMMRCVELEDGLIVKEVHRQVCNMHCHQGWAYSRKEGECCGQCISIGCAMQDKIFEEGDIWLSENGCTRNTCVKGTNGQFFVSSVTEKCPPIKDCSNDNIYKDGCCPKCKYQMERKETCSIEIVPPNSTIGIIKYEDGIKGTCINQEYLQNYTRCSGTCHSTSEFTGTVFAENMGEKKECKCCSVDEWRSENVILICDMLDESYEFMIHIPTSCTCKPCKE